VWAFTFGIGDVAVSDDWGRSGFKPGIGGAPVFSVSASVTGAGTLRLSEMVNPFYTVLLLLYSTPLAKYAL